MSGPLDHSVHTGLVGGRLSGVHDYRSGRRTKLNDVGHLSPAEARQGVVGNDRAMGFGDKDRESFYGVSRRDYGVTKISQEPFRRDTVFIVICDEENRFARRRKLRCRARCTDRFVVKSGLK